MQRLLAPLVLIALSLPVLGSAQTSSRAPKDTADAIAAARAAYAESAHALSRGRWSERDTTIQCAEEAPEMTVRIHRDATGAIRRLEWSGGTDDHAETHQYYYDVSGKLRFAFFTLGAFNGTRFEQRVYFDAAGTVVRRLSRLVKGPGYTYQDEQGILEARAWRRAICE